MRKGFLLFIVHLLASTVQGQVPEKKNTALLYKITGTWCYPCGSWGWDLTNDMVAHLGDKVMYMGIFNSNYTSHNNLAFYNATAVTLGFNFRHSNWPSFGVNGINLTDKNMVGNLDIEGIKQDCYESVESFIQDTVFANAASTYSIEGDSLLQVSTRVVFFEPVEGDYYLATYLVEEGALNYQNGQTGLVPHKGVLRGAIDSLDWGRLISSDSIIAHNILSKEYTYKITDASWDLSKLVIYNIIWKRVGTKYEYVNGSKSIQSGTSIKRLSGNDFRVYPNPASETLFLQTRNLSGAITVKVRDMLGRIVLPEQSYKITVPEKTIPIDVSSYPSGLYLMELTNGHSSIVEKIWKD